MRPPGVRRHCREETFLGNVGQARSRYYKGFASARTETPPFIFGKVGVPRSPMHLQGGRTPAPDNVKKVPPLNLESHKRRGPTIIANGLTMIANSLQTRS